MRTLVEIGAFLAVGLLVALVFIGISGGSQEAAQRITKISLQVALAAWFLKYALRGLWRKKPPTS